MNHATTIVDRNDAHKCRSALHDGMHTLPKHKGKNSSHAQTSISIVSNVLGETAVEGVASVAVTTGRRLISAVAEEEDAVAQGRSVLSALFSSETGVTERIGEETFTLWLV